MKHSDLKLAYRAAVRSDLLFFAQESFRALHGTDLVMNWHIKALVHSLQESIEGRRPRSIINLPPRQLKSLLVSVILPAFMLGHDPRARIIVVSYSDDLAKGISHDFRRLIGTEFYRDIFPEARFDVSTANNVVTDLGGFRYAVPVTGTLTGKGGDVIIVDDPSKPEDVNSDRMRDGVNQWFGSTLLSRLNDANGVVIVVQQRLHVNDLSGYLKKMGGFHTLSLPAIATQDELIPLPDGAFHARKVGDVLDPERYDLKYLNGQRNQMHLRLFNAQYQQAPEAREGAIFKRKYFEFVDKIPYRALRHGQAFISVDPAASTSETADFTAICILVVYEGKFYVHRVFRNRMDFEALVSKVKAYLEALGSRTICVIENTSVGTSLIAYLNKRRVRVEVFSPRTDKVHRAYRVLPFFEEGRVVVCGEPGKDAWVDTFLNEILSFPNGANDDQVDSLVQLLMMRRVHVEAQQSIYR